jgi:hypothetical protein
MVASLGCESIESRKLTSIRFERKHCKTRLAASNTIIVSSCTWAPADLVAPRRNTRLYASRHVLRRFGMRVAALH